MQKNPHSESGLFNPRTLLAVAFCTVGITIALLSFAAPVPPDGTLTPANQTITYTDGPLVTNPTHLVNGVPICTAPNSCSSFSLTVNASSLAATHNLTWSMQWPVVNVDIDIFLMKDGAITAANLITANIGYSDPATLTIPIPADGTKYRLLAVCSAGTSLLNGTVSLTPKYPTAGQGAGAPPRYINYPSGPNQATNSGEPSIGVDWNPNVASLKNIVPPAKLNTGGVAFFTAINDQWRSNFDDCSSPALNVWQDANSPIITGLDPIGFVDHFRKEELGRSYPPPQTPGRIFALQLAAGSSTAAYSDNDGASWVSFVAGGPPAGPDHETLGGGPFHAPIPTPPAPAYPNATYYCSQFGVENASCSRSDDGGVTFGPGVPIFPPQLCAGGIHGHLKVSPQGTAYVPNSACGEGTGPNLGVVGVALSTDNGITWTHQSVPGSTGSADPAVGIGQNNVGKPAGQVPNTLYLGWVSADGHMHAAHSPDEGATWQDNIDISSIFGIEKAVFAATVAGDDNRAAVAFLGTDPSFYPTKQVWHLYIAHTYDGGKSWILTDQTPNDPVQIGNICLLGTGCSGGRNLLDFIGIDVDAEGRVLVGYADGCVNCSNTQNTNQSTAAKGVIARQSGGRRLFSAFDPIEPAPPAAPRLVSAVRKTDPAPGVEVGWLEPDNGGAPIIGYNIYRGTTSGSETFLATVSGAGTTKYFDQTAPATSNWFYRVTALNDFNGDSVPDEGEFCRELNVDGVQPAQNACIAPYLNVQGAAAAANDPTGQFSIQRVNFGEPFIDCSTKQLTAVLKVNTMDPSNTGTPAPPPVSTWQVYFKIPGSANSTGQPQTLFVEYDNTTLPEGEFLAGWIDPATGSDCSTFYLPGDPANPVSGTVAPDGTITMNLRLTNPVTFGSCNATAGTDMTISPNQWTPGMQLTNIKGVTYQRAGGVITGVKVAKAQTAGDGTYTTIGNTGCISVPPIAVLTGSPLSGPAPLTVNFDASGSNTDNPCGVINSYTMNFGDGTAPVTQASPMFSHTYTADGFYQATLTVKDTTNLVSTNPAQLIINVGSAALNSVVSRKTHAPDKAFDVLLPTGGAPGIECRAAGANNSHQVIFRFAGPVTLTGAAVIAEQGKTAEVDGSPVSSGDGKEVTVNLKNVSDAQTIRISLLGLNNSPNAVGVLMMVKAGDTNADTRVNVGDTNDVKTNSGSVTNADNFRTDVNLDGRVNVGDVNFVKAHSGGPTPTRPPDIRAR